MFLVRSVCLSVCPSDNWKSCERILTKFLRGVGHGPRNDGFNFGDDPDHRPDPGAWSPKTSFIGLSKKLPTDFDEILWRVGCGLETNWLHFGDDQHHDPDPGVRSPKSGVTGFWHSADVCAFWALLVTFVMTAHRLCWVWASIKCGWCYLSFFSQKFSGPKTSKFGPAAAAVIVVVPVVVVVRVAAWNALPTELRTFQATT